MATCKKLGIILENKVIKELTLKLGYFEKATKFEQIFHLKFDITEWCQIFSGRFFQIFWPSQNVRTLSNHIP